jgi:hypothetical protein
MNYARSPFAEHPDLVDLLRAGDGRVFAHTNRSLMRQGGTSQFSIHPLKGACKPAGVYGDLYPASVCLSGVTTYFAQSARDRIVSKVRERVAGCESVSQGARASRASAALCTAGCVARLRTSTCQLTACVSS